MPNINFGNAAPGMGRLAMALGGGSGGSYQKAFDNEMGLQSKLAQAMAAIEAHGASADLNRVKADSERAELASRTPEAVRRTAMLSGGIPLDEDSAVDSYFRTGQLGGKYKPLAEGLPGPTAPAPDWQGKLGEVARAIAGTQRALTIGDKNSENIAKASSIERGDRLSDAIINGTADRNRVAGAQAAAGGKALFHTDTTGSVLDQFTGNLDTNNPMAGSTINLRTQQAGQAKAGASENYAQADNARASAAKTRSDMNRDIRSGDIKEIVQPDGTVLLVNKVTGLSRPARDEQGRPVMGKGGGADKPMTEGQSKANLFGGRMVESGAILSQLEDEGVTNTGITKGIVQGTAGMVPLLGDKLSEAAGAGMNVLPRMLGGPNSKQQQVDQARRDFINATLRRESGATIQPSEFSNAEKQYFPQPGDGPEVLAQKRRNRELATQLMLQEVPESHRYQPKPKPKTKQQTANNAAPEGGWDGPATPGGRNVRVDF